jgi:hypothetical protein
MEYREKFANNQFGNGTYHASWLTEQTFNYFKQNIKLNTNCFTCPNKGRDAAWIKINPGNPTMIRLGFYSLAGLPTEVDTRARDREYGNAPAPWDSPKRSIDNTPYTVLLADIIEKGTELAGTSATATSAPHASIGPRTSGPNVIVDPTQIGSEGGNVGLLDGSVQWRKQFVMRPRYVRYEGPAPCTPYDQIIGYW